MAINIDELIRKTPYELEQDLLRLRAENVAEEKRDLIGKRILIRLKKYNKLSEVEEAKILEVSPSGLWTKIQNSNGTKFWRGTDEVLIAEILQSTPNEQRPG